jgi:hypothetical protein
VSEQFDDHIEYWFPVLAHPGAGGQPWFATDENGLVRRFVGHPMGASSVPSFYVVDATVYTTGADETRFCAPGIPWFSIAGSLVSPGDEHPDMRSHVSLYERRTSFDGTHDDREGRHVLMSREHDLLSACVEFADTLGTGYNVVDTAQHLADRCVELVEAEEAGIMLADRDGTLCHIASSCDSVRVIDLFELEQHSGPNLDAYESGLAAHRDLRESSGGAWPAFATRARDAGFASVSVLPLRLRNETIGTLGLFSSASEPLDSSEQLVAQAFADITTIGILQQRALGNGRVAVAQLENALDSRVVIEQAKGILSERLGISIDVAFTLLRGHARDHNASLQRTASGVVGHALGVGEITTSARAHTALRAR